MLVQSMDMTVLYSGIYLNILIDPLMHIGRNHIGRY